MKKTTWFLAWVLMFVGGASVAQAQTSAWQDTWYGSISAGVQQSRSFDAVSTPEIYNEPASVTVPHEGGASFLFDVAGGRRVWRNLAVGVAYSRSSNSETPTLSAEVPNPVAFGEPRNATSGSGKFSHTESVVHFQFLWMMRSSRKIQLAVVAGPSLFSVGQDVVTGLNLTEGEQPFATVTIASVETAKASKWATGFAAGVDGTYLMTPRMGAGVFIRYSAASANLAAPGGGTVSAKAGGFQVGGGLRVRF